MPRWRVCADRRSRFTVLSLLLVTGLLATAPSASAAETKSGRLLQAYEENGALVIVIEASNSCGTNKYVVPANSPNRQALETKLGLETHPPRSLTIQADGCVAGAAVITDLSRPS